MVKRKKKWLVFCCFWSAITLRAQDPQYTQFYANPMYLNPAFTGAVESARLGFNYRNQWSGLDNPYSTVNLAFDKRLDNINGGIGTYFMNDRGGYGNINTSTLAFLFSKEISLSSKWRIRAGAQGSFTLTTANFNNLVFGDQLGLDGSVISNTQENLPTRTLFYPDLGSGALLYSKRHWLGVSGYHLLSPNQSVITGYSNHIPVKLSVQGGTAIPIGDRSDETTISPVFQLTMQGQAIQSDIGAYYQKSFLLLGAWYRGIPFLTKSGVINQDALAILAGFKSDVLSFAYSYDLPVSSMIYSTGSHEISLIYLFQMGPAHKPRPTRNQMKLPCPRF